MKMQKNKILIIAAFLLLGNSLLHAQKQTTPQIRELEKISNDQRIIETERYEKAMSLAAKKGWRLTITDDKGNIAQLVGVDELGFPMYVGTQSNVSAAATIGTNKLWTGGSSGLNLDGSSALLTNKLALWDGGLINKSHVELIGRITQKDNPSTIDNHATHVTGTLVASGVNSIAKGMAHGIKGIIAYDFSNHISEISSEASNLLVSNHSYGSIAGWRFNSGQNRWEFWGAPGSTEDWKFGNYSSETQMWDSIATLSPNYLIVKSAGNNRNESGPAIGTNYWRYDESNNMVDAGGRPSGINDQTGFDLLPTYSNAKNALIVGNVFPISGGYTAAADVVLSNSSSFGPTDDGRIKPDVVANGAGLTSTGAGSNTTYSTLSGTSMSSPTVAGSAILLQELFMRKNNDKAAWSSTIKGLILHTTDKATTVPGPDYKHGWGLANFARAASVLNNTQNNLVVEKNLKNDSVYTVNVVASGKGSLSATIVWTDPAGTVTPALTLNSRDKKLVNDLDLRIKQGNKTFFPWKLDGNTPASPATQGDNDVDNVEKIEIDSVLLGESYTIEVRHKGQLIRGDGSQNFSLVVSGIGGTAYAAATFSDQSGTYIDTLSFGGISTKYKDTCSNYQDSRLSTGTIESGGSNEFFLRVKSCDNSNNIRYAKIFIDINNDGNFGGPNETFATSQALFNDSTFKTTISLPTGFAIGDKMLMRVIVSETNDPNTIQPSGNFTRGETQDYTLAIVRPSNDLALSSIVYPFDGECADGSQYVTIKLRNSGSKVQRNIPLSVDIRENGNSLSTLSGVFNGPLNAGAESEYTFQTPFIMKANSKYTFTAKSNLLTDQNAENNQVISEASALGAGVAPTALQALICNNSAALFRGTTTTGNFISWFASDTAKIPFALSTVNTVANTSTLTPDKKYFGSFNDLAGIVGPKDKTAFASGGYNEFNGNFVRFSNTVPMVIESVKMFIGNPGKVRIILADLASENAQGGYSFFNLGQRDFIVSNTRPTAQGGLVTENDPNDKGMVFNLNFAVTTPGNHILILQCTEGATVYRNNNIAASPYPQSINGINSGLTITGNSVVSTETVNPNQFYYFFYDMKVELLAESCPTAKTPVTAINNVIPTITRNADTLISSVANGNQWQLNGFDIQGEKEQKLKVTQSGKYRTSVVDEFKCESLSAETDVTVTSVINVAPEKIGFSVAPNPSNGNFNLSFSVTGKEDLGIAVLNSEGREVYRQSQANFSGNYKGSIRLQNAKPGVYLIKITHGLNQYIKRVIIL
jgi:Subtilase family/Secretion system C-terminal sorting domain/GEVED domain